MVRDPVAEDPPGDSDIMQTDDCDNVMVDTDDVRMVGFTVAMITRAGGHIRTASVMSGPRRIHSQQRADRDLFEAREMLQHCGSFEAELESQIDAVERGQQQMDPSARLAALLLAGHYVATS